MKSTKYRRITASLYNFFMLKYTIYHALYTLQAFWEPIYGFTRLDLPEPFSSYVYDLQIFHVLLEQIAIGVRRL